MSKKKKLNLNDLKVKSFVTSLDTDTKNQAKGGMTGSMCETDCAITYCRSAYTNCTCDC
jgi:hypothetical protein